MIEKREIIVLISRKKYSQRSFYFHHKTTACFTKNNVSFHQTQRVVSLKTTCRFTKNNVSFHQKQRLVLPKITACFPKKKSKCRNFYSNFFPCPPPYFALLQGIARYRSHKIAQIAPICAEINLIIRNKTLTLPNLLRDFYGCSPLCSLALCNDTSGTPPIVSSL